jgi:FMN phosphatase YigB (HAD superfamily)
MHNTVIMDLDNTLYEYAPCHAQAHDDLVSFLSAKVGWQKREIREALELARERVKKRLGAVASSHSRLIYIEEMMLEKELGYRPEVLLQAHQTYWSSFLRVMQMRPGAEDFLLLCRQKATEIIVLTDLTSEIQHRKMIKLGIESFVDKLYSSEFIGSDKSSNSGFEIAMKTLTRDKNHRYWFIGDSITDLPSDEWLNSHDLLSRTQRFQVPKVSFSEISCALGSD